MPWPRQSVVGNQSASDTQLGSGGDLREQLRSGGRLGAIEANYLVAGGPADKPEG